MIRCQSKDPLGEFFLCSECGAIYCIKHFPGDKCKICNKSFFLKGSIEESEINGLDIQWVHLENSKIGIFGFNEIDKKLLEIFKNLQLSNKGNKTKFIISPSKKKSIEINTKIFESIDEDKLGTILSSLPTSEKSRYSLIYNRKNGEMFIFLNLEGIKRTESLHFFINYIQILLRNVETFIEMNDEEIEKRIARILFTYNSKLGIPFVSTSFDTLLFHKNIEDVMKYYAIEYFTIKEILNSDNISDVKNFLSERIDLILEPIDWEMIYTFEKAYEVLSRFMFIFSYLTIVKKMDGLFNSLKDKIDDSVKEAESKLEGYEDLLSSLKASEKYFLQKEEFSDFDDFIKNFTHISIEAVKLLKPKYLRFSECLSIMQITENYKRAKEFGLPYHMENIGGAEEFAALSEKIFNNENVCPEVRLISLKSAIGLHISMALYDRNPLSYRKALVLVEKFVKFFDRYNSILKSRIEPVGNIGYHDCVLDLLSVAQLSLLYKEKENYHKLVNIARELTEKHNLPIQKIMLEWRDFTLTHNYDNLKNIYAITNSIDFDEERYAINEVKMLYFLISAVLIKNNRLENIEKAKVYSYKIFRPDITFLSIRPSLSSTCLLNIFEFLIEANNQGINEIKKYINAAYLESLELEDILADDDPLNSFVYKTKILYGLINEDYHTIDYSITPLLEISNSDDLKNFIKYVEWWMNNKSKMSKLFKYPKYSDRDDPWFILANRFIENEIEKNIETSIIANDAIILVEGDTDVRIFNVLNRKVCQDTKLEFIDCGGWANINNIYSQFYPLKDQLPPIYIIFDGDVKRKEEYEKVRRKLIEIIPDERVIRLSKYSIENYFMYPDLISKTFDSLNENDVIDFLKPHKDKRNKKSVLKLLFKHRNLGKYDPEKAESIVENMQYNQIDDELIKLFDKFKA